VTEEHFPLFAPLKQTGYDGVELEIFEGTPDHYARVARELDNHELRRTGVTIIPDQQRNILSADPARRAAGVDHLKWAVDCAAALGAELLCGPFYQPLGQFTGAGPTAEEQQRAADAHRQAAEYAAQVRIPLAVEALNRFECYFLNTLADTAAHVRRVGHPNFHLIYDTFHANLEEKDPVGVIAPHLPLIEHVHVSENDRGTPGRGHVPWDATFRALRGGGYDGWLTIEAFGRTLPELAATTCVWRDLSTSNEEVYRVGFDTIREGWERAAG
jgi:D-psicose/D-tagatose/L-ribulose 3-epimerase